MQQGFRKFQALSPLESAQAASLIEQLCTYSQYAITAALSCDQKPVLSVQQRKAYTAAQPPAADPILQQLETPPTQAVAEAAEPASPFQALFSPIMKLVVVLVAAASKITTCAVLLRPVKLAASAVDATRQQDGPVAAEHVAAVMDPQSTLGRLR